MTLLEFDYREPGLMRAGCVFAGWRSARQGSSCILERAGTWKIEVGHGNAHRKTRHPETSSRRAAPRHRETTPTRCTQGRFFPAQLLRRMGAGARAQRTCRLVGTRPTVDRRAMGKLSTAIPCGNAQAGGASSDRAARGTLAPYRLFNWLLLRRRNALSPKSVAKPARGSGCACALTRSLTGTRVMHLTGRATLLTVMQPGVES